MTTKPKGAGKALRLNLPGAPEEWHFIPGVPGLYHPTIPTPIDSVGLDQDAAKKLHDNKAYYLEWSDATDAEIKAAAKTLEDASQEALSGAKGAARQATGEEEERARIHAAAEAASAVTTKNTED